MRRVNVSLDSRDPERFRYITRRGELGQVLAGIDAAAAAGLAVKINMVALKGLNEDEIEPMLRWCAARGHDLTLIETMPMGEVEEDRTSHYLPLDAVKAAARASIRADPVAAPHRRAGALLRGRPGIRLGLITPLTGNFCTGCNRIRVAATGTVYGCLGHDQKVELRDLLRGGGADAVERGARRADRRQAQGPRLPDRRARPAVARHMSVTGG